MGEEIMHLLTTLNHERAITVIMVTHDPHCATFAQHQVIFRDGRIVGSGPAEVRS
jgi:ABC-type lipoprotein export system ATPase subunit